MQARHDILEGEQGFRELFAGDPQINWQTQDILAPAAHIIETAGVMPKRHPCCGSTHMIIDALLDLADKHNFGADDVKTIDTLVGIANYRNLAYPAPVDQMQARFSMQYCVARTLRQGYLGLSDFTPAAVRSFAGDDLLDTVTMQSYSLEEECAAAEKLPHVVTITLRDGRVLQGGRQFAVGTNRQPFSDSDRLRKFRDCCDGVEGVDEIYGHLQKLDTAGNLKIVQSLFV